MSELPRRQDPILNPTEGERVHPQVLEWVVIIMK